MSVAWPQKTVKTSYVESRGNLSDSWHIGLVVPQDSVDDVHQLVGDSPDGDDMMLPRAFLLLVQQLQNRVMQCGNQACPTGTGPLPCHSTDIGVRLVTHVRQQQDDTRA